MRKRRPSPRTAVRKRHKATAGCWGVLFDKLVHLFFGPRGELLVSQKGGGSWWGGSQGASNAPLGRPIAARESDTPEKE